MSKRVRVRHHVNPLSRAFEARQVEPVALPAGPVEVELGCADALFLFDRAPLFPGTTFIGVEIRAPLVDDVNLRAAEAGLGNLRACLAHINLDLDGLFPDQRLDRVFVNFPDPWFKRRHHKRRLMNPDLVESLHRKLRPGGELFFQSDVWELAIDALAVLEKRRDLFTNTVEPWTFLRPNPYQARSLREVRCEDRGMRIWRMQFRRL